MNDFFVDPHFAISLSFLQYVKLPTVIIRICIKQNKHVINIKIKLSGVLQIVRVQVDVGRCRWMWVGVGGCGSVQVDPQQVTEPSKNSRRNIRKANVEKVSNHARVQTSSLKLWDTK